MQQLAITNTLKLHILLLLSQGIHSGYDIRQALEKKFQKKISNSNVYPFLQQLERKKYVTIKKGEKRDKKCYTLTKEGHALLHKILQQSSDLLDALLTQKIKTCLHCGCQVYKGAYEKKAQGKIQYFCCEACANH